LGACTTFNDYWAENADQDEPEYVPIPISERPIQDPISANHFELESAEQSVVGVPQVVLARDADTFSDLARAYGLGYDELAAANPDVDPWFGQR
jgi:hypothetical protein